MVALSCYALLPNTPLTTHWLKPEERQLAHDRMNRDRVDETEKGSVWQGLKQAFSDPRVWLFILMYNMHLVSTTTSGNTKLTPFRAPTVSRTLCPRL